MDRIARLIPRPARERLAPSLIDVELDPAQLDTVRLPYERAVLVLGEAGHGKTTVALHRLAHIWRARPTAGRMGVVVPTEGLARLLQPLLRRLGVDIQALTYDEWACAQARRAFGDLPRQESEQTPPAVQRLKRDPALRGALAELAKRPPGRIDDDTDRRSDGGSKVPRKSPPKVSPTPGKGRAIAARPLARRGDLQHLFGDRALLEAVARSSGAITDRAIEQTLDHTRVQFSLTAEREFAHVVDRERLIAVDRRALDEGTATGNAGRIDVEDYAVLFELERLRALRAGRAPREPRAYDALLIDEAQDLAPLELALLGRSLRPGGSLIVAGDIEQQTDPTTSFSGWQNAMGELGAVEYSAVRLDIGYRCPPGVAAMARSVLGERRPDQEGASSVAIRPGTRRPPRERGVAPLCVAFANEAELIGQIGEDVRNLLQRDRRASVAMVCRSPITARRFANAFRAEVPTRLVFDGHFLPRGPLQVTIVDEVKGLEFDFVVVPDATAAEYPDTPAARRALYVAITRARYQVVVAHVGLPTPLVQGFFAGS